MSYRNISDPAPMNWVIPNKLAIGDMTAAGNMAYLKQQGIGALVTARGPLSQSKEKYSFHNIDILHIPIADSHEANIGKYFPLVYNYVENSLNNQRPVLIHCAAGISRSATLTLSYLMRKYHLSPEQAINLVREVRPCINPNPGFLKQLKEYKRLLTEYQAFNSPTPFIPRHNLSKNNNSHVPFSHRHNTGPTLVTPSPPPLYRRHDINKILNN